MTPEEFDAAASRTRLTESTLEAARLVLCEGLSAGEAGRRLGRTRAWAHRAAARIRRAHREAGGYPASWEVVTVVVPPDVAAEVREKAADARQS